MGKVIQINGSNILYCELFYSDFVNKVNIRIKQCTFYNIVCRCVGYNDAKKKMAGKIIKTYEITHRYVRTSMLYNLYGSSVQIWVERRLLLHRGLYIFYPETVKYSVFTDFYSIGI